MGMWFYLQRIATGPVHNILALLQRQLYSFFGQCDLRTHVVLFEEKIRLIDVEEQKCLRSWSGRTLHIF